MGTAGGTWVLQTEDNARAAIRADKPQDSEESVARLMTVINMVRASALPPKESAELMQQIRSEIGS